MSQMIIHDTDMRIPIYNTIYDNKKYIYKLKKIDINKLNNLNLKKPNIQKFPLINIIKQLPDRCSLFDTVIVATNDILVDLFLNKKISYNSISKIFFSFIKDKKLKKYRYMEPNSIEQIIKLKNIVQIKIKSRYT